MSTLYMYHWNDTATLDKIIPFLNRQDSLVIYGVIDEASIDLIANQLSSMKSTWRIVFPDKYPNINDHQINHSQWLELITEHKNTLAWK